MKSVLFIAFCLITNTTLSQKELFVKGYPVEKSKGFGINIFSDITYKKKCEVEYQTLKVAKDSVFYVIGDSSCGPDLFSNWYVIVYSNGKKYYSPKYQFKNTNILDSQISILNSTNTTVKDRINSALLEIEQINILRKKQEEENKKIQYEKELQETDSLLKLFDKNMTILRNKNWVLYDWSWEYPNEYSSFTEVTVKVINPYKQRIKYIWFSFQAFNDVDDPVRDGITGATTKTVKGIGPIEYGGTGTYTFETVFYSKVIGKMKMTQIKIQFFDGTSKLIKNPTQLNSD